jgi:effector-binding domain-containing protein
MQQYAKEHNYVFADDPIEFCHIDRYETSDIKEYLTEVQVLVKPVSSQNYS